MVEEGRFAGLNNGERKIKMAFIWRRRRSNCHFFVLLLFRLNIPQKFFITGGKQPIVSDVDTDGEAWMAITQNNKKIGYAFRRRVQTENGSKFFEDIFVWINAMGVVQPVVIWTAAELKTGGEISGFRFTLESKLMIQPV